MTSFISFIFFVMTRTKRPDNINEHPDHLKKMDEIVEYLLADSAPDMTPHQKAKHVSAKLKVLMDVLEESDVEGLDINTHAFVYRLLAREKGHFNNTSESKVEAVREIPNTSRKAIETALTFSRPFEPDAMQAGLLIDEGDAFRVFPDGKIGMSVEAMQLMINEIASRAQKRGQSGNSCEAQN
jgi:hypothetical protein